MKPVAAHFLASAAFVGVISMVALTHATAPPGRYTVSNGTVYDTKTKLTWQQTISSSTFTTSTAGPYCSGLALNGLAWRLPTLKELATIVDFSVAPPGPTIDATSFPGTPAESFLSSTVLGSGAGAAQWSIDFSQAIVIDNNSNSMNVRCVH